MSRSRHRDSVSRRKPGVPVMCALARAKGGSVVAQCSFVRGYIEKHAEYADLVA